MYNQWRRFINWYRVGYTKTPYRYAFATMFIKGCLSDMISQCVLETTLSHDKKAIQASNSSYKRTDDGHGLKKTTSAKIDLKRTLRFGLWAGLYSGCFEHKLYNVWFTKWFPSSSHVSAFCKMMFDCFVHTPLLYFPVYYISKAVILGTSPIEGVKKYTKEWKIVNFACWKIWVPVQMLVFMFVPIPFRLAIMGAVGVGWYSYLSFLSPMIIEEMQREEQHTEDPEHFMMEMSI